MFVYVTERGICHSDAKDAEVLNLVDRDTNLLPYISGDGLEGLARLSVIEKLPRDEARVLAPVSRPGQFIIAGLNYRAHCEEIGRPVPSRLVFGTAPGGAAHPHSVPVVLPQNASAEVDYEGEIALVIAKTARHVAREDAWRYVAGVCALNDVSARDVQAGGTLEAVGQAKGFPTFKPFGPCLATPDEFADRSDIGIRTWVNGELRQHGRSADMVFSLPEIIELVSAKLALAPGDVICTGTPGGVAHGGKHPYLVDGDVVEIEVEGLPLLRNRFVTG